MLAVMQAKIKCSRLNSSEPPKYNNCRNKSRWTNRNKPHRINWGVKVLITDRNSILTPELIKKPNQVTLGRRLNDHRSKHEHQFQDWCQWRPLTTTNKFDFHLIILCL